MTNNRSKLLLKFKQIMEKYIDKSALVAEIERRMDENRGKQTLPQYFGMVEEDLNILSFIDTLEVKEVDLEKKIDDYINEHFSECDDGVLISDANSKELTLLDVTPMARHFFELGFKVQKGE